MKNNSFEAVNFRNKQPTANPKIENDPDRWSMEKQEFERFGQDTKHRQWLVIWMMIVVGVWLAAVLIITMCNKLWCLKIDDKVLITLLATTTVNVLGLSKIILGGLFSYHYAKKRHKR